ncbi:GNAT family N-acetyltransferase [Streptomyces sp. TRM 70351]|uniref:GNAT family N-acetyltransferase n=1 Tax=Streptomyces sp. TRM 70351 TaxID=3116552 RepID=UPI002E7B7C7D|nr:GNAT family N-acetyltransferase [Streptomyces sp. TRM 70351]MEE1927309.1 GNAT family N-acetyltransferase [Streptomyces sp. TRM 70351]
MDSIDYGHRDRRGLPVTLRPVTDDNWRAVADVAPRDEQRAFVAALAARYLLLSLREDVWHSLAVRTGDRVTGHVMWALDETDGAHWLGGMIVDADHQGHGTGRAAVRTLVRWLADHQDCREIRLSCHPANTAAAALYTSLGFVPTGDYEDEEYVTALRVRP